MSVPNAAINAGGVTGIDTNMGGVSEIPAGFLLAVDEHGTLVDGDVILAICALDARARGELPTGTVVTTVMTNLGFRQAMDHHGISVTQTAVGDRYVLEAMLAETISVAPPKPVQSPASTSSRTLWVRPDGSGECHVL